MPSILFALSLFQQTKRELYKMNSRAIILAVAVAGAFAATAAIAQNDTTSGANQAGVKCYGINSCKGRSSCQTASNACNGKNSCKGTGYLMSTSSQECITKGGSLTEPSRSTTQSATQPYGQ